MILLVKPGIAFGVSPVRHCCFLSAVVCDELGGTVEVRLALQMFDLMLSGVTSGLISPGVIIAQWAVAAVT